jgi:hypothetical protein
MDGPSHGAGGRELALWKDPRFLQMLLSEGADADSSTPCMHQLSILPFHCPVPSVLPNLFQYTFVVTAFSRHYK